MPQAATAHEVTANRVTLVQREPNHVSVTFFVDYVELLRRTLAPTAAPAEFAIVCAGMDDAQLRSRLAQARKSFEDGAVFRPADGRALRLTDMHWPEFGVSRQLLREAAMASVVGPADHVHPQPLEIHGELVDRRPLPQLSLQLPAALGEVIVVSYRPRQLRLDAGASAVVKF